MSDLTALLLPVDGDLYALPLEWAHEVVAAPSLTHLVSAPPLVLGLFNLRGQIVPLLDTAALLGTGRLETIEYVVVVTTARGLAGLATSGLPRRVVLETPAGPSELPGTTELFKVGRLVVSLLDPAQLLTAEQIRGRAG